MNDEPWQQLDRRTVWVTAGVLAGVAVAAGIPTTTGILRGGAPVGPTLGIVLLGALLLIAGGAAADYVRWRKTFYRITGSHVELRSGVLQRKHRAVHRDRIRTVDLTANPLHRVFGVAKVSIGTGEQADSRGGQLALDPLSRTLAEQLRRELLHRRAPSAEAEPEQGPLAQLDWGWIRYAPISIWPGVLGVAVLGALWQVTDWFGLEKTLINRMGDLVREQSLWLVIPLALAAVLVIGLIATLAFFVESWWNYRLEREPGGTLRLHRGLIVHRTLSLAEDRLRGIELVEPFGARQVGAARLEAVATGLAKRKPDQKQIESKVLLPESPRAHADAVAAEILAEPESPTSTPLRAHPPAARSRRLTWALAAVAAVVAVLVILGLATTSVLLHVAWVSAIVLGAFGVFLALEVYRNLGHGSSDGYLVLRHGALARRTVALRRSGVIGWTIRQTPFQRRAGLITVTATTAASAGAYTLYDADASEGLQFAAGMVPGVLGPFLTANS
jgi:putative membrane protein